MAWAKPQYGKGRIDWAGDFLAHKDLPPEEESFPLEWWQNFDRAVAIVNNWRAIHSYPLQVVKMSLKGKAKRICPTAIVAQRLKRIASIKLKLRVSSEAGHHPKLSQMQDVGGCRAVMDTVDQVRSLEKAFEEASKKNPHRGPQYFKTSDYLDHPKPSGYRGVHLVYKYRTTSTEHSCYNDQRIEIQLRSKLQHYWATAVETYSTFTGEALKSNIGSNDWKRFFALMSSALAIKEKCPPVPGTPATLAELAPELRDKYYALNVQNVLTGWTAATRMAATDDAIEVKTAAVFLLVLDPNEFNVEVTAYQNHELAKANADYAAIEKDKPNLQAVLVSVDSLAALRTAYPNYFLDTSAFLDEVREVVNPDVL